MAPGFQESIDLSASPLGINTSIRDVIAGGLLGRNGRGTLLSQHLFLCTICSLVECRTIFIEYCWNEIRQSYAIHTSNQSHPICEIFLKAIRSYALLPQVVLTNQHKSLLVSKPNPQLRLRVS